jgi:predicted transcriptional regulator
MVCSVAGRTRSTALTDAEHRIMRVLWEHPDSTVAEIVQRMAGPARPAYNSVLTILRILERKGYVRHEKDGRAFVYSPIVDKTQARRGALSQVLSRFFNGSPSELMVDLLGHDDVNPAELAKVRSLIEHHAAQQQKKPGRP